MKPSQMKWVLWQTVAAGGLQVMFYLIPVWLLGEGRRLGYDWSVDVFLLLVCVWAAMEANRFVMKGREGGGDKRWRWHVGLIGGGMLSVSMVSLLENTLRPTQTWGAINTIGALMSAFGILLRWGSTQSLGALFWEEFALRRDHRLITGGIYHWLRHPCELGTLALGFGVPLLLGSWVGVLWAGVQLFPTVYCRIQKEEHILSCRFPGAYNGYARKTRRLYPGGQVIKVWLAGLFAGLFGRKGDGEQVQRRPVTE